MLGRRGGLFIPEVSQTSLFVTAANLNVTLLEVSQSLPLCLSLPLPFRYIFATSQSATLRVTLPEVSQSLPLCLPLPASVTACPFDASLLQVSLPLCVSPCLK